MGCVSLSILLAHREWHGSSTLAKLLEEAGFMAIVEVANSGAEFPQLQKKPFDLVVVHHSAASWFDESLPAAAGSPTLFLTPAEDNEPSGHAGHSNGAFYLPETAIFSAPLLAAAVRLAQEGNAIADEKRRMEERRRQSERLLALGELAGGMAHDLNNNIASILLSLQLLRCSIHDNGLLSEIANIEQAANDAAETIRRVRDEMERRARRQFVEVDLSQVVLDVVGAAERRAINEAKFNPKKIGFHTHLRETPKVLGNPSELREALTNVIRNAVEAIPREGEVVVEMRQEGKRVVLSVSDNGVGIPFDARDRIFDAFFTTKGRAGHGLGLSIVSGIIQRHDGEISVDSTPGAGTIVSFALPIHPNGHAASSKMTGRRDRKQAFSRQVRFSLRSEDHRSAVAG